MADRQRRIWCQCTAGSHRRDRFSVVQMTKQRNFLRRTLARAAVLLALSSTLVAGSAQPVVAQQTSFDDVPADAFYTMPVNVLAAQGVFSGTECSDGFCPNEPLLRWQMAVWIVRVLDGEEPSPIGNYRFSDVDAGDWYAPHVERMFQLEVTSGCGDGSSFCPDREVSRAQMAAFLTRAFELPDGPNPGFDDVPVDSWYISQVAALAASGITTGCGDGSGFCPSNATTRGQMATFLHRAINRTSQVSDVNCDFSDHSDRVRFAVYQVRTENGIGTAFYIGQDEWLTAAHVVVGENTVTLHNGYNKLAATISGRNSRADMALLSAPGAGIMPLTFSTLANAKAGDSLYVVGYPLSVAEAPSVTRGVLSRIEMDRQLGSLIVTDAAANPGNSGGPLVDECGNVIGMMVAKQVAEAVEGIAYAIAETTLQERILEMHSGESESTAVDRTYEECFGSQVSQWNSEWTDGPSGWTFEVWRHKSDGRTGASAYLGSTRHSLNDYRNALAEGCEFAPYMWFSCTAYEASEPFWIGVWWSGIPIGTAADSALSVEHRLDNGPRTSATWTAVEDSAFLDGLAAVSLVMQLRNTNKFEYWGYDANGTQVIEAQFDTTEIANALEHLRDTCNWESAQPPSATQQQPGGSSAWVSFEGENISGKYVGASTGVKIGEHEWQDDWLALVIRCTNRSVFEIFLLRESGSFFGNGGVVVEYRFGNQDGPTSVLANPSTNHESAFLRDPMSFLQDLRSDTSGRLFVNLWDWWDYTYAEDAFDFEGGGELSVVGVSEHVEPVAAACGR